MRGLFEFEQDGRYPLRRIPMIMRSNLDVCGIKISLAAWITLNRTERECLVAMPCASEAERNIYRETLIRMLQPHADNPDAALEFVDVQVMDDTEPQVLPAAMIASLMALGLPVPTLMQWSQLNDLQRFALLKLTRSGHKNTNLLPAMKEFGLL